jgi:predicted PurR-regulated permease PerM/methylmalonyl-CoA mutase cobalamin-binding subunit
MAAPNSKNTTADAIVGLRNIALTTFVLLLLYYGRSILIPIALAALLTFLFTPLVSRLERWIGRICAVITSALTVIFVMVFGVWILTHQLVDLAAKLPDYKVNIKTKLRSFKMPDDGIFSRLSQTIDELKQELPGADKPPAKSPETPALPKPSPEGVQKPGPAKEPAVPVQVVETHHSNPLTMAQDILGPVLDWFGVAGLVLLLFVFMSLQHEDLRSRFLRLVGQGRIGATRRAMDDAGARVSRYLLMQLIVNVTYGIPIAIGLYFIGVPNALLWGALATVLRFVPYIGPWIAASFPTIISLAVSTNWTMPLMTICLFIILELVLNNVMEPWLYGSSTGVSSLALIVAAIFWASLWGPVGLILATPLTVCLVVIGRHVPRMAFLSVMLSDEEALTPAEECYQRLLSVGLNEASELTDGFVKANSLTALYDTVLIPVVTAAEMDYRREALEDRQRTSVEQGIRDIVEELGTRPALPSKRDPDQVVAENSPPQPSPPPPDWKIHCIPARGERDELAGGMLAQLLEQQGYQAESAAWNVMANELVENVAKAEADAVCISVIPPSTVIHARYLATKLRARLPKLKIIVGLWGVSENVTDAAQRLRDAGVDEVVTSLADAVVQVGKFAHTLPLDEPNEPVAA